MAESTEDVIAQLEQDYLPLDAAVVRVILSDYDVSSHAELAQAKAQLDILKESALNDDVGDFDPSGTSGHGAEDLDGSFETASEGTDLTGLSNGISQFSLETASSHETDDRANTVLQDIEKKDMKEKQARLMELFPSETSADIEYVLGKVDGNFTRAMDLLLNHVFFNHEAIDGQEKVAVKGIDAFFQKQGGTSNRKRKGKKRQDLSLSSDEYSLEDTLERTPNKWNNAIADIDFIALHCNIPHSVVSSVYHKSGATVPGAMTALLDNESKKTSKGDETLLLETGVVELLDDFPSIPVRYCAALIRITSPSSVNAHQLAKALTSPSPVNSGRGPAQLSIVPQYARYQEEQSPAPTRSPRPSAPSSPRIGGNASDLANGRHTAFNQASQYYRRGKSDRLMGGAAAYYSQMGREFDSAMKAASAAEADSLATMQSTPTSVDLHGITVKDATRIASERVNLWWHNLGEGQIKRQGVGSGYRIITGVGRHSDGGVGKLGPAVGRMLIKEGWRVTIGTGELVVTGIVRRK